MESKPTIFATKATGLVTGRIPTNRMLNEAQLLSRGAYYQACIGSSGVLSNDWIDITADTLWSFREACRQNKADVEDVTRRTENGERFNDWILDEAVRFPMTEATLRQTLYGRTITQGTRNGLFRGERQMWPASRSTLERALLRTRIRPRGRRRTFRLAGRSACHAYRRQMRS